MFPHLMTDGFGSDPGLRAARLNACSTHQAGIYLAGFLEAAAACFRRNASAGHLGGGIQSEPVARSIRNTQTGYAQWQPSYPQRL